MRCSRATAPTARPTTTGATLMPRSCSHSAVRMSSASSHSRGKVASALSHGSGRRTTISCANSSKARTPAKTGSDVSAMMTLASLRSGVPARSSRRRPNQRGRAMGVLGSPLAFTRRRSSASCFSRIETAMPVAVLMRATTWRSVRGSRWASARRPSSVPSALRSGGLVSASAAAISAAWSSAGAMADAGSGASALAALDGGVTASTA